MHDILHDFPIKAPLARVFAAVSTPAGLDTWWTKYSVGRPELGTDVELGFGPGYAWRARVRKCVQDEAFELEMIEADKDWSGTRVGFQLVSGNGATQVRFYHRGWPELNDHYRTSCYCWAMYLRMLKRHLEVGESVPYERRLDA